MPLSIGLRLFGQTSDVSECEEISDLMMSHKKKMK